MLFHRCTVSFLGGVLVRKIPFLVAVAVKVVTCRRFYSNESSFIVIIVVDHRHRGVTRLSALVIFDFPHTSHLMHEQGVEKSQWTELVLVLRH